MFLSTLTHGLAPRLIPAPSHKNSDTNIDSINEAEDVGIRHDAIGPSKNIATTGLETKDDRGPLDFSLTNVGQVNGSKKSDQQKGAQNSGSYSREFDIWPPRSIEQKYEAMPDIPQTVRGNWGIGPNAQLLGYTFSRETPMQRRHSQNINLNEGRFDTLSRAEASVS
ncbi:hypothetical protein K469DRAFT_690050 [Zopfia rhizophila CBS 207.26]|uniref:Uncharacterized protein n=1 Tax=Zopfia rhizophila CBS 207.26 TaxID=1314779 RepID=A0A6A6DY27_9PEZI|nr:hypothetical protein K469DRAFT_690050 [Zopfia rhizophila CBS 207.26]